MNNHKATPKQWAVIEKWCSEMSSTDSCILELRSRIEQLEAQASNLKGSLTSSTPPPVATDDELLEIWNSEKGCRPWLSRRAIYNLGVAHGQAGSRKVAEPAPVAGGLVARVIYAICWTNHAGIDWSPEARAAILEVAKWLREQGLVIDADLLEQEAGR